jgi:DNA-binding MarR family transcriptional regulator
MRKEEVMAINSENLIFIIHQTHDMIRVREDILFGEYGLTTEQYSVLKAINYLTGPVRVTDVARRTTRSVNSVSMIVDRMVKVGLLRRVRDTRDRRTVHLKITSKAAALLEPAALAEQEFIQRILSNVSREDEQAVIRLFETLHIKLGTLNTGSSHDR